MQGYCDFPTQGRQTCAGVFELKCPRCGNRFEAEERRVICSRDDWGCIDEIEWSNKDVMKGWRGLSLLRNVNLTDDHWEDMANSAGGDWLLDMLWKHKDHDSKIKWMLKKSKEVL